MTREKRASGVAEEHHESEVHVTLVVAMEESRAGIVRDEVDVGGGVCGDHEHVFIQPGKLCSVQTGDLESMPMKMKRVIVRAAIESCAGDTFFPAGA